MLLVALVACSVRTCAQSSPVRRVFACAQQLADSGRSHIAIQILRQQFRVVWAGRTAAGYRRRFGQFYDQAVREEAEAQRTNVDAAAKAAAAAIQQQQHEQQPDGASDGSLGRHTRERYRSRLKANQGTEARPHDHSVCRVDTCSRQLY